jgi:predicted ArsR family transcriptional regulator
MTPIQERIYDYIEAHQLVRRSDVELNFGLNPNTAKSHLRRLAAAGAICHRREPAVGIVWATVAAKKPTQPARRWVAPAASEPLKPYEQAASVWDYARRCAA